MIRPCTPLVYHEQGGAPGMMTEIEDTEKLKAFFDRYQLKCMMNVFPNELDELRPLLELYRNEGE
jgi:hypothetical protein